MLTNKFWAIPILAPADITETATVTQFVNATQCNHIAFALHFGTITGAAATVTVQECPIGTSTDGTEAAIGFQYRLTEAAATEAMGALTAVGSSGFPMAASDDGKVLIIEFNPDTVTNGTKYLRCVITPDSSSVSACVVGAVAYLDMVYKPSTATT
jgi:hypothetical protein